MGQDCPELLHLQLLVEILQERRVGLEVEVVSSEEMLETETMIETLMTAQMIEITEIVIVVEMEDMEEPEEEMEVLEAEAVIIGQQEFKTEVTGVAQTEKM